MKQVALLGATGSIGRSTLDVIARSPQRFTLAVVAARQDDVAMADICKRFAPARAILVDPEAAARLRARLRDLDIETEVLSGHEALCQAAGDAEIDVVVAAIVGAAGLASTMAAVDAGKQVLLANKEALVCAGELLMAAASRSGATLVPLDSEHNAIFQCLPQGHARPPIGVSRLWLTASGGPFRGYSRDALHAVTPEQALKHPNWQMGAKISIDSATLMNKGLEVIEAHHLFGLPGSAIRVLVHPQSTVHSLVEYIDGSFLAQLGSADMRIPIAHALGWPERIESGAASLDLLKLARLDFDEPDLDAFPCLRLAFAALDAGGTAPAILNAANEVAVDGFLNGQLGFLEIAELVNEVLNRVGPSSAHDIAAVLDADRSARDTAVAILKGVTRG